MLAAFLRGLPVERWMGDSPDSPDAFHPKDALSSREVV